MAFKNVLKKVGIIAGKGALAQVGIDLGGGRAPIVVADFSDEALAKFELAVVRGIIRAAELIDEAENEPGS